jgi:hypothetical protein
MKRTVHFTIPKSREFVPAEVIDATGSDLSDIWNALNGALMNEPNRGGYQTSRCSGWTVTVHGLQVVAKYDR